MLNGKIIVYTIRSYDKIAQFVLKILFFNNYTIIAKNTNLRGQKTSVTLYEFITQVTETSMG